MDGSKILIISKNTIWTQKLIDKLQKEKLNYFYSSICSKQVIDDINPDWVFFFHWSDIVSKEIYESYKCVVLHVGNLPKNRGGSPIQNQILEGINNTKVNAIEMVDSIDGGGIYHSIPVTLQGNLTDIWLSLASTSFKLISYCIKNNPLPKPQVGTPQTYKRKKDNEIKFGSANDLLYIYDQIRMLDDESYPNPYLDIGNFRLEFSRAKLKSHEIITDVSIKRKK